MGTTEYTAKNGYRGILWGRANMTVLDNNGDPVFNTNCRPINTLDELKRYMDGFEEREPMLCIEWG